MGSALGTCFVGGRGENEATSKSLLDATDEMMAAEENLMAGYSLGCYVLVVEFVASIAFDRTQRNAEARRNEGFKINRL